MIGEQRPGENHKVGNRRRANAVAIVPSRYKLSRPIRDHERDFSRDASLGPRGRIEELR